MTVYHGSTLTIEKPLATVGRAQLDFGRGFYVTNLEEQACAWAKRMSIIRQKEGIINVYELDYENAVANYRFLRFEKYDERWLQFIVANRKGGAIGAPADMIEGGVANDRVIDTVEAYISGLMPMETALGRLALHAPNNQLCLCSQTLIDHCLSFKQSYKI